jgi:uncharacterized protein (TIGR02118 family)
MVRFLVLYTTPTDIEGFERHYRDVHVPLVKKLAGLRRYTLSSNATAVRAGHSYYFIAELDWDDLDSLRRAFGSAQGQAAGNDVANLTAFGSTINSMIYELTDA